MPVIEESLCDCLNVGSELAIGNIGAGKPRVRVGTKPGWGNQATIAREELWDRQSLPPAVVFEVQIVSISCHQEISHGCGSGRNCIAEVNSASNAIPCRHFNSDLLCEPSIDQNASRGAATALSHGWDGS